MEEILKALQSALETCEIKINILEDELDESMTARDLLQRNISELRACARELTEKKGEEQCVQDSCGSP